MLKWYHSPKVLAVSLLLVIMVFNPLSISYYNSLNKPWFVSNFYIFVGLWVVAGIPLTKMLLQNIKHPKSERGLQTKTLEVSIVCGYLVYLKTALQTQNKFFFFLIPGVLTLLVGIYMYKIFSNNERIVAILIPTFFIFFYFCVVGLYVLLNN